MVDFDADPIGYCLGYAALILLGAMCLGWGVCSGRLDMLDALS
jgi:hypothetical protein